MGTWQLDISGKSVVTIESDVNMINKGDGDIRYLDGLSRVA